MKFTSVKMVQVVMLSETTCHFVSCTVCNKSHVSNGTNHENQRKNREPYSLSNHYIYLSTNIVLKIRNSQPIQSLCLHNNWVVVTTYQKILDKYFKILRKVINKLTYLIRFKYRLFRYKTDYTCLVLRPFLAIFWLTVCLPFTKLRVRRSF